MLGPGCYQHNGQLYASCAGTLTVEQARNEEGKQQPRLSVRNAQHPPIVLRLNDIVVAEVVRIRDDGVYVRILQINDVKVLQHLEGHIKREHIREKEIDSIKVDECYLPGDVIRAKFVSFGDGRRIYLSTAGEELGVLYARNEISGKLMLPYSWTEMICLKSGLKEKRKVAKPNSS